MSSRRCGSVVRHRYDPLDPVAFPWYLNLWGKDHIRHDLCTTDQFFTCVFPQLHDVSQALASPKLTPCRILQRICHLIPPREVAPQLSRASTSWRARNLARIGAARSRSVCFHFGSISAIRRWSANEGSWRRADHTHVLPLTPV